MKTKHLFFILCAVFFQLTCLAQTVSNVRFEQVAKKVKITYSLDKQANISVSVSEDGGKTWSRPLSNVSGHVGKQVQAGNNTIYWDVLSDCDKLVGNNICFKVRAQGGANRTITVGGVSFEMVYVEGGTFTMGATSEQGSDAYDWEKPTHRVTLSDYYIGRTEVTQALWRAVMGSNPSHFEGDTNPVEMVSWNDCQTFIRKLNSLTGLRFALPTEAQWEYAARGGNKSRGYKYAGSNSIDQVAWYDGNANNRTHIVALKQSNELGLYDMSGNVWELCQDGYGSYSSDWQTDPQGPSSGFRFSRGGSWGCNARDCRVSFRANYTPSSDCRDLGLRLVLLP